MKPNRAGVAALASLLGLLAMASPSWADDPPDRVGRLNFLSGTVSFHPASVDDWTPATLNYPLSTGDHLWTDQDGQAEVHVGSTAIRMASSTDFELLNCDDTTTQIRLSVGSLNVRLRHLDTDEVMEIDTPNSSVTLTQPGRYRIDVRETGDTSVSVRLGEAEVIAGNSTISVFARQVADINGIDSPEHQVGTVPPPDDWDSWCDARDVREDRVASYVPREMVGAEDLADNGTWQLVAGYGPVWRPRVVPVGWAPYHFGHWAWVDPWGWTWIDDAPWGFAPFHYGRWAFVTGAWVWVPGTPSPRPVYAPALVAFVGGDGFGATVVPGGGVGWFPLGPREPYVPPYTVTNVYVRNVNYGHVTVVNVQTINVAHITYVNRGVPGAVVVVPNQAFVRAQPVPGAAFVVPPDEMRRAPVRGWTAPVAPVRESVMAQPFAPRGVVARPPAVIMSRPVVGRMAPPPPPVPFAARQQALQAHPGRPVDPGTLSNMRVAAPPPQGPVVIVNPAGRYRGGPAAPGTGPGTPAPRPVNPPAQQGPRTFAPGTQAPRVQPAPQVRQPGPQPAQPAPRMQPGPQPAPAPRMQPGTQPGQGPGPQAGIQPAPQPGPRAQPAPRVQPGAQHAPDSQPSSRGQSPAVRQQGPQDRPQGPQAAPQAGPQAGPSGGQRSGPAPSNDDQQRRQGPGGQGPGGPQGGPGGN